MDRVALLRAVAEAGRGSAHHQAHYNPKEGGHVYFPHTQVRLFLREDMHLLDAAVVDAPAVEVMLYRLVTELGAVDLDWTDGEAAWTFRAFDRPEGYLREVARGEGWTRVSALAAAYAGAFAPKGAAR